MTEDLDLKQKLDFIASHGLLFNTKAELANRVGFGSMTQRGGQSLGSIADKERTFERLAAYASQETNEFVVLSRDVDDYMKAEEFFKRYKSQLSNEDTLLALLNLVFGHHDCPKQITPRVRALFEQVYDAENDAERIDVPMLLLMHFDILPVKSRQNDIEVKELKDRYRQVAALLRRLKDVYGLTDCGLHDRLYVPFESTDCTFTRLQALKLVRWTLYQISYLTNVGEMNDITRDVAEEMLPYLFDGMWSTEKNGQTTDFWHFCEVFAYHYSKKAGRWTVCRYDMEVYPYRTKDFDGTKLSSSKNRNLLFQIILLESGFVPESIGQDARKAMERHWQIVIAQTDDSQEPARLDFIQGDGLDLFPKHTLYKNTERLAQKLESVWHEVEWQGTRFNRIPSLAAITHDYIYVGIVDGETLLKVEPYMYDVEELRHCLYREYFKIPRQTVEGLEEVRMDDGIGIGVYRTKDGQRGTFIFFVSLLHCIDADNEELLSRLGITRVTLPEDYGDGMFADDYLAHVSAQYVVTD